MDSSIARRWLPTLAKGREPLLTLLCVPHAGGGASAFRRWRTHLPSRIDVRAVQLPGREERWREELARDVANVVETLADACLKEVQPPYAIFGHSFGSLLAFELTHALLARGAPAPLRLFVSARSAPDTAVGPLAHTLPDAALRDRVERYAPDEFRTLLRHPELGPRFLAILRSDFALSENYVFRGRPRLKVPLTCCGARSDALIPIPRLEGWRRHAHEVTLREFEGSHFYPYTHSAEVVKAVLADLTSDMRQQVRSLQTSLA